MSRDIGSVILLVIVLIVKLRRPQTPDMTACKQEMEQSTNVLVGKLQANGGTLTNGRHERKKRCDK